VESHTATTRKVPLCDCTDEELLAEVKLRQIDLHERVTESLVLSKYTFGRFLGKGASATVYECKEKRNKKAVAIKVIKKDANMNDEESMATELEILRLVRHRFLLNCYELFESTEQLWVVMELVRGGPLVDRLVKQGVYSEAVASKVMKQVLMAVRYLHSMGVVHRDLKLENLLVTETNFDEADVKVADFGLSALLPRRELQQDEGEMKKYNKLTDMWGTRVYFAPEIYRQRYGPQVDLWAVGVVLFILLSGHTPFQSEEEVFSKTRVNDTLTKRSVWAKVSDTAKDMIRKLLEINPVTRLNAGEALNHPFIVFKGSEGSLEAAHTQLKREKAKRNIADMMNLLNILQALEDSGATQEISPLTKQVQHNMSKTLTKSKSAKTQSATDSLEEIYRAFHLLDYSKDGCIDTQEFGAFLKIFGVEIVKESIADIISLVDKDLDGKLNFEEFCTFMQAVKENIGMQVLQRELEVVSPRAATESEKRSMIADICKSMGQPLNDEDIEMIITMSKELSVKQSRLTEDEGAVNTEILAKVMVSTKSKGAGKKRRG